MKVYAVGAVNELIAEVLTHHGHALSEPIRISRVGTITSAASSHMC